jgi:hypothetical protein
VDACRSLTSSYTCHRKRNKEPSCFARAG